jgi:hypothetical protein
VKNIIRGNRGLSVREVGEDFGISTGPCHTILTEDLGMHQVSVKCVPRLLTDDRRLQRFSICKHLLQRANYDKSLLENFITGDEMWVYGYGVKTNNNLRTGGVLLRQVQVGSRVKAMPLIYFSINGAFCIMNSLLKVR